YTPTLSRLLSAAAAATASSSYAIYAMGARSRAHLMRTAPPCLIITLGLHLTQQKCLSLTPPKPSFVRAPCPCTTPTTQQSTREICMQAHRRRFGTVGSSNQRVPSSLPSTAAPPAPSSPPTSPLPSFAQSPADLPRESVAASPDAALAANSSRHASLRITQRLGLARRPREGSSFLQQNTCLRPQQLSRNSLLKQQKSPMTQDMIPTTWKALSTSRATYRRTWAMRFCWLWAGRQPDAMAQEECGRVRRAHALPFAPNDNDKEDKKQQDLIEERVVGPAFNSFRMHRFEGVHPPAPASRATSSTTTVDAANSTLIPVFLSAFAPLRRTRCSARLRELPVPPRKPPPLNTATIIVDKELVDENGGSANGSDAAEERSIDVDVPGESTSGRHYIASVQYDMAHWRCYIAGYPTDATLGRCCVEQGNSRLKIDWRCFWIDACNSSPAWVDATLALFDTTPVSLDKNPPSLDTELASIDTISTIVDATSVRGSDAISKLITLPRPSRPSPTICTTSANLNRLPQLFDNADELDDKAPKLMNFSNCGAPEIGLPEEGGNQITNSGGA
ncbi:hypothetical protein PCANC_27644, partial [Puccinia coronata f. sp. avenae]